MTIPPYEPPSAHTSAESVSATAPVDETKEAARLAFHTLVKYSRIPTETEMRSLTAAIDAWLDA